MMTAAMMTVEVMRNQPFNIQKEEEVSRDCDPASKDSHIRTSRETVVFAFSKGSCFTLLEGEQRGLYSQWTWQLG
jgi:hypothetical protein